LGIHQSQGSKTSGRSFVARANQNDPDYAKHSRAALDVAREVFEAENVLESILDRAGISRITK